MKDALGHGSDAHGSGVEAATNPQYHWEKQGDTHRLVSNLPGAAPIASVRSVSARPELGLSPNTRGFVYELHQSFNTGNAKSGTWGVHGSVQGAKNGAEQRMSNSWNPPDIRR